MSPESFFKFGFSPIIFPKRKTVLHFSRFLCNLKISMNILRTSVYFLGIHYKIYYNTMLSSTQHLRTKNPFYCFLISIILTIITTRSIPGFISMSEGQVLETYFQFAILLPVNFHSLFHFFAFN